MMILVTDCWRPIHLSSRDGGLL